MPPLDTITTSLRYAVAATVLAVGLGVLAAGAIAYGRGRWRRRLLDTGLMLPLGTSAVTIGFGLLITMDRAPLDLRGSWIIIPIAHALVAMPFVVRAVLPSLRAIDPHLREAAAVLGARPARIWSEVDPPMVGRAAARRRRLRLRRVDRRVRRHLVPRAQRLARRCRSPSSGCSAGPAPSTSARPTPWPSS